MAEAAAGEQGGKKVSLVVTIGIVAVLSLFASGGGWLVGKLLAPPPAEEAKIEAKAGAAGREAEIVSLATPENGIVALEPMTANLAYPSENLVRLEVSLMFKDKPDPVLAEEIHQDMLAYLRTVSLQQIQGPRGFQYLREDLQERVDLRSQGRVTNVMVRTFVIE